MSEEHYVGLDLTGFENNGKMRPVSRVTLQVDDDNVITAGDDTGFEITASCPHATQEMANAILARLKGYQYQMFTADEANIDPAAELGDGVTVGGVYGVISSLSDDGSGYPNITAPGEAEQEDEFPTVGPMEQELNRKVAQTRSLIEKTSEQIRLAIEGFDGRLSQFSVNIDNIVSDVEGLDGAFSKLEQTVNGFTYTGPDGKVMISNGSINLTGVITWDDLTSDTQDRVGGVTEEIVHTLIKDDLVASPNIEGANIYGGTFWNTDKTHYLQMGLNTSDFGSFRLYEKGVSKPYFSVYYMPETEETILCASGDRILSTIPDYDYGNPLVEPNGVWDFKFATVTGLPGVGNFVQTTRLTSSHTEFYLYVVFGGIGVYTPVYAAVLGRTYTCAMSVSAGRTHPIYGMTITVSAGGSVSVSNIYAVYPASEGQSPIAFDLDSYTIYAR